MSALEPEYLNLEELCALHTKGPNDPYLHEIRDALVSGKLRALGSKNGLTEAIEIPSHVWRTYALSLSLGGCAAEEKHFEANLGAAWARISGHPNILSFTKTTHPIVWLNLLFRRPNSEAAPIEDRKGSTPHRPKGAGSFKGADENLFDEMKRLMETGAATSVTRAAQKVVGQAAGDGTEDSKVTRLVKAYKKQPGSRA